MAAINVVGGGIAGLVASIACAEAGAEVRRLRLRSKPAYNIETGLLCDSSQTTKWSRHPGEALLHGIPYLFGASGYAVGCHWCDR